MLQLFWQTSNCEEEAQEVDQAKYYHRLWLRRPDHFDVFSFLLPLPYIPITDDIKVLTLKLVFSSKYTYQPTLCDLYGYTWPGQDWGQPQSGCIELC